MEDIRTFWFSSQRHAEGKCYACFEIKVVHFAFTMLRFPSDLLQLQIFSCVNKYCLNQCVNDFFSLTAIQILTEFGMNQHCLSCWSRRTRSLNCPFKLFSLNLHSSFTNFKLICSAVIRMTHFSFAERRLLNYHYTSGTHQTNYFGHKDY